jgi:hypothetical protein
MPPKQIFNLQIQGSPFWRLNKVIQTGSNLFEIQVESVSFKFIKESLLFLSAKVFNHLQKQIFLFLICAYQNNPKLNVNKNVLIQSFIQLYSLFQDQISIESNPTNVDSFIFLSDKLDNFSLLSVCNFVKLQNQPKEFFFSSQRFSEIHQRNLLRLNDFCVFIRNEKFE